MINRRDFLGLSAGLGATLGPPRLLAALSRLPQGQLLRRAIPSTGEMIPVIGLGSSATFAILARAQDASALEAVFQAMVDRGARVFDTAPSYGASEQVSGDIVNQLGVADTLLWATKVNVAGRGGTAANPAAARAQTEKSFAILKRPTIDLIQVHDMGDLATQLPIVHEFKKAGRVRYVGITTTFSNQYAQLIDVMRNEPLDFFGVDHAADNRDVENVILPLAIDEKIALLAYPPSVARASSVAPSATNCRPSPRNSTPPRGRSSSSRSRTPRSPPLRRPPVRRGSEIQSRWAEYRPRSPASSAPVSGLRRDRHRAGAPRGPFGLRSGWVTRGRRGVGAVLR
jgi:aryl-alcohol dehydrogenase-like predicted oxidoreductase